MREADTAKAMLGESLLGRQAPEFLQIQGWLNSEPLTMQGLRGKVVLLDFWTFDCANCIRTLPHIRQLHAKYAGNNFVLVGVHTPEFDFEKIPKNVEDAVKRFRIEYPVAIDNENVTWRLYGNQYWPRQTLVDTRGRVCWEHAGEGAYDRIEKEIRELLNETGTNVTETLSRNKRNPS